MKGVGFLRALGTYHFARGFVPRRGVVIPTTQRGSYGKVERERSFGISRKVADSGSEVL